MPALLLLSPRGWEVLAAEPSTGEACSGQRKGKAKHAAGQVYGSLKELTMSTVAAAL